jgi:hypothetical protein
MLSPTDDEDVRRRRLGVEGVDRGGAMRQHRALVDRAFVGHFTDIERGRIGE